MINRLSITLLFFALTLMPAAECLSQGVRDVIHIRDLPPDGILLDTGWRFKVGDNAEYASADYDDSGWEAINPTLDIVTSLPQIPEGKICWLRIHLSIDSTIRQLVMVMQQSVASEIYLNGQLIHRLGVLGMSREDIKAINPNEKPLSFPFNRNERQLLAIRFAKQPGISYGTHWMSNNLVVKIRLNSVDGANAYHSRIHTARDGHDYFRVGVFFILSVLYMAFYFFYPPQRANLYFSIYAIIQAIVWGSFIIYHKVDLIETYPVIKNFFLVLQLVGHVIMLLAVYELLRRKKDWVFYSLIVLAIACIPVGIFIYDRGWKIYGREFTHVYNIGITWVAFRSFWNSKNTRAAVVVVLGGLCFELIWLSFTLRWIIGHNVFTLAHLSVPLAISLYLGYDFAKTSRSLQQKLKEVGRLSAEKQQILADQNEVLEKQVTERTSALKRSMDDLKSTQAQLIQSEKMASLGELTAGIAHEIQNPLNFVNNFAEVNKELISEMDDAIGKGNLEEIKVIARNISDNQEKINHHGKRADAIVKSMLQHSRSSTGQKELTDINALCDEYLRLTYHGYRAKDKTFVAKVETNFDQSVGKINVMRQDIGRVILNLINNAFYAVIEKKKSKGENYQPEVIVSTRTLTDKVEIIVKDNGNGIPEKVKEKIFQPFFTTKPTGQGTGLGLSLAYDIVTKVHGGELTVNTKAGDGAEFIVSLPTQA